MHLSADNLFSSAFLEFLTVINISENTNEEKRQILNDLYKTNYQSDHFRIDLITSGSCQYKPRMKIFILIINQYFELCFLY